MALGGDTTALAVNIEVAHTHIPCLPVAVQLQCWACRRATVRIYSDGKVEEVR
jgi:tartrate dehydratase alpha subunit/fumarate hydratase class I-like protein